MNDHESLKDLTKQLKDVLLNNPVEAQSHFIMAQGLEKLGRYEEAINHYERAINVETENLEYRYAVSIYLELLKIT